MKKVKQSLFLGRTFCDKTATWLFSDGSGGVVTEEDRQEIINATYMSTHVGTNGVFVLAALGALQDRLKEAI